MILRNMIIHPLQVHSTLVCRFLTATTYSPYHQHHPNFSRSTQSQISAFEDTFSRCIMLSTLIDILAMFFITTADILVRALNLNLSYLKLKIACHCWSTQRHPIEIVITEIILILLIYLSDNFLTRKTT